MSIRALQVSPSPAKQLIQLLVIGLALGPHPVFSSSPQSGALADLSLEDLANIEIISVSKRPERLLDAPAAIFVITNDDIRRAGVNSLPEALRLAPNIDVARVNSSSYAISSRGFNNSLGNKLLVLIDGRTVYSPLFSGVNWDTQSVMLEDVERIEVISGPGATLWGANAVNGVINVITRRAQDTQGGLVSASAGNRDNDGAVRYGGKFGEDGYYRVYGMGFNRDNTERNGIQMADSWGNQQGGFRADWGNSNESFTVQGDAYTVTKEKGAFGTPEMSGMNFLTRWNRQFDNQSKLYVQAYYDQTVRDDPSTYRDQIDTFDIEAQYSFQLGERHNILWGGGSRYAASDAQTHYRFPALWIEYKPENRHLYWNNLFIQDEIALSKQVSMTLGIKAETNVYTGVEYLPSARLAWKPDNNQLVWAALSRSVRAPSRTDRDFFVTLAASSALRIPFIIGGPDFQSEVAKVLEVGYRGQSSNKLSYSATAFYSLYDRLRSGQPAPNAVIQNMMNARTYGFEGWGTYQALPDWRLSAGLKTIRERFTLDDGSRDPDGSRDAGNDPEVIWLLRSALNLTPQHEFDVIVRHTSALPDPGLTGYTAVDMHLGWRATKELELSVTIKDMFDQWHPEFVDSQSRLSNEIGRSLNLKARWDF